MNIGFSSLDVLAEIVPGKSAAGFTLGSRMPDEASLLSVTRWTPDGSDQLCYSLSVNSGWLIYSYEIELETVVHIDSLFYGVGGYVGLQFENKFLTLVSLGPGYLGALPGGITIGAKMDEVVSVFGGLEYDEFEGLYYPGSLNEGSIAFEFDMEESLVSIVLGGGNG